MSGFLEADGAIDIVVVGQRQPAHAQVSGARDEGFRRRGPAQQTVGGMGVEFNVILQPPSKSSPIAMGGDFVHTRRPFPIVKTPTPGKVLANVTISAVVPLSNALGSRRH